MIQGSVLLFPLQKFLFEFLVASLSLLGACNGIVGVIAEAGEFLQESAEERCAEQGTTGLPL